MFVQEEPWLMLFVLFCFSVCVEPASAEDNYCVLFSHTRTRGHKRDQAIAHQAVSALTPGS